MAGQIRIWAAILGILALTGCGMALPFGKTSAPAAGPNPVTGSTIEVTALPDAPAQRPSPAVSGAKAPSTAPSTAAPVAAPVAGATVAKADPASKPPVAPDAAASDPAAPDSTTAAPAAPAPAPVVAIKSEAQLACEKKKGVWSRTSGGGLFSCITYTKDSGKHCTRATQCDSQCLARSNTCAPFKPLFGCNDILDDSGRRMTQCLE